MNAPAKVFSASALWPWILCDLAGFLQAQGGGLAEGKAQRAKGFCFWFWRKSKEKGKLSRFENSQNGKVRYLPAWQPQGIDGGKFKR
jgi:hypothetical protein